MRYPVILGALNLALWTLGAWPSPAFAQNSVSSTEGKELVAVLELDGVNASKAQLAALSEELRAQLLQSGIFRVVDRQQIDTLLKEQAFQQTGCTSQECAVQVGRILGVRKMIVGRVTKIEDDLWQVSAQIVDVESAETFRAVTLNHQGKYNALLTQGMSSLAAKLAGTAVPHSTIASAKPPTDPVVPATLAAGQTWREPVTGMELISVPSGEFEMGCPDEWFGGCYDDEKPPHHVRLSSFWLGKTEVTQGQWKKIMGSNPSRHQTAEDYPVEQVSWQDAQVFVERLNSQSPGAKFRLPTEAEWEFACRGGGKQVTYGTSTGDISTEVARTKMIFGSSPVPVAKFAPNSLGLYGMSGNVSEWVQDAYSKYTDTPAQDPLIQPESIAGGLSNNIEKLLGVNVGTEQGRSDRVVRGGNWNQSEKAARCTARLQDSAARRANYIGFRLARTP